MIQQTQDRLAWWKTLSALCFLLPLTINAAEANPKDTTPASIKPIMTIYEAEIRKAISVYQETVAKASEKAIKDMDAKMKEVMNKDDLEGALAIEAKLNSLKDGEVLVQLEKKWNNGDMISGEGGKKDLARVIVGSWKYSWGKGEKILDFKDDKTIKSNPDSGNESTWDVVNGKLAIFNKNGKYLCVMTYDPKSNSFSENGPEDEKYSLFVENHYSMKRINGK